MYVVRDRLIIAWTVIVFALYALLAWIFPEIIIRHHVLAFCAILAVPIVRVSLAPYAVEWSRHR